MANYLLILSILGACCLAVCQAGVVLPATEATHARRAPVLGSDPSALNANETVVMQMAHGLLNNSFSAGSGYAEVWIRDTATFVEVALEVNSKEYVREALAVFFSLQALNGEIPDGYINDSSIAHYPTHKTGADWPWCQGSNSVCKNTVETDQETSLVQAVHSYVKSTGDTGFLTRVVKGSTVMSRMEQALQYLLTERFDTEHSLIYGATTIDWGDIQPEDSPGTMWSNLTHRAIDIYDNAMFVTAVADLLEMKDMIKDPDQQRWIQILGDFITLTRHHLWDQDLQKFVPHIYLSEGSPFPGSFEEGLLYYHGGTAVAAVAAVLTDGEILTSYKKMKANVDEITQAGGSVTIGVTVHPPYPAGLFKGGMGPYSYQDAGDWEWFSGRMVRALADHGHVAEAEEALKPIIDRAVANGGFFEWYDFNGKPQGSAKFHGSAGVLGSAIRAVQAARERRSAAGVPVALPPRPHWPAVNSVVTALRGPKTLI